MVLCNAVHNIKLNTSDVAAGLCWRFTLTVSQSDPSTLWSPAAPTLPSLCILFLPALSAFGNFQASHVSFTWCRCHLGLPHLSPLPSSPVYHSPWLIICHRLIHLDVPQNVSSIVLNHIWRFFQFWSGDFQYYASHLVVRLQVRRTPPALYPPLLCAVLSKRHL